MKPTNDLFEQQVKGLYEGHEVPAPASTKDAVFRKLDAANSTGSLSFASKALLVTASILSIGAVYWLLNQSPTTPTDQNVEVKEVVESPVEVVEDTPEVIEVAITEEAEAEQEVEIDKQVEDVVVKTTEESSVEEVIADQLNDAQEIKEIAPQLEVVDVETTVDSEAMLDEKKDEQKEGKKEEEVEWILPGKINVEK